MLVCPGFALAMLPVFLTVYVLPGIEHKILQKSRAAAHEKRNVCALFTLRLYRGIPEKHLVRDLRQFPGVASIQER